MIISCIGDSLTEGDYGIKGKSGIANVHEKNYPYFLAQKAKCDVRNFGKCGLTSTSYLQYYKDGNVDVKGSDLIIIMLGSNGGMGLKDCEKGNSDFNELISLIKCDAPGARIVLCTPPHCTENPEYSNCGYVERVNNATAFIKEYAENNGYEIWDINALECFCAKNEAIYQGNDGLHFIEAGYKRLAEEIYKLI